MEVHFNQDLQAKLDKLAIDTGRAPDELVEDVVAAYLNELAEARETLNSRYDDLKAGKVKPIPGDDVLGPLPRQERGPPFPAGFMTGYDFHPRAVNDLDEIWGFIAADNLDAADRMIGEILAAIDALVAFPDRGHKRPDLTSRPLRFTLVGDYLIAYAPEEKPLWVIAALHGRRNPRVMAAILRSRE
jgi:plasmid stabilization system protein ParE/predicted transcriptional regulator